MNQKNIGFKILLLLMAIIHCLETAKPGTYAVKLTSFDALKRYDTTKGKESGNYLLEEPKKTSQSVTYETTNSDKGESNTQDSQDSLRNTLNDINNHNMKKYIGSSKSFRKLQDGYENLMYFGPLGKFLGPMATITNIATGIINENNDKIMYKLYNKVRDVFDLKGEVVTPDYDHEPKALIEKRPSIPEEVVRRQTADDLDSLDDLLKF